MPAKFDWKAWKIKKDWKYYAVARGNDIGIFTKFRDLQLARSHFGGRYWEGFYQLEDAENWLIDNAPALDNLSTEHTEVTDYNYILAGIFNFYKISTINKKYIVIFIYYPKKINCLDLSERLSRYYLRCL